MPSAETCCCTFAWGLLGDQLHTGKLIDSHQQTAGWNPPLGDCRQQELAGSAHVRQLAVGWSHALLLLSDGQLLLCPTSTWRDSCCQDVQAPAAAAAGSSWQPLQLPTPSGTQQQLLQFPPPAPSLRTPSQKVLQVSAGDEHFLFLTEAGSVWACGSDKYGQVGSRQPAQGKVVQQPCRTQTDPSTTAHSRPTSQNSSQLQETSVKQQAAEEQEQHPQGEQQQQRRQRLLQLRERQRQHHQQQQQQQEGAAHAANVQQASQQPASSHPAQALPCPVLVLGPGADSSACQEPVLQVAAGACHSVAVTRDLGRLYCWGWNLHGQCCTGSTVDVLQPQLSEALDGVPLSGVAAGLAHTVCVSRDGAVYACGWNGNGQLGTGKAANVVPGADTAGAAAAAGPVGGGGSGRTAAGLECMSSLRPVLVEHQVLEQEHVTQVACGARHTLVLTASGAAYAWGWNKYGQCCCSGQAGHDVLVPTRALLPSPQAGSKATVVHAGRWHSCISVCMDNVHCNATS